MSMIKTLLFAISTVIASFVLAQSEVKISEYASIPANELKANSDGKLPYISRDNYKFSNSGKHLFVTWGAPNFGGGILIYDIENKKVAKKFVFESNDKAPYSVTFHINPQNENELAIQLEHKRVFILHNWKEADENVFTKVKSSTPNLTVINSKSELWGTWYYSSNGENIFLRHEVEFEVINIKSSTTIKEKEFSSKEYDFFHFIDGDRILLVLKQTKSEKESYRKRIQIYDMNTDVLSETHTIPDFSTRFGLGSQRSILCVYDQIIDLESLQIKADIKESFDAISDKSNSIPEIYPIPNIDGYIMFFSNVKMLVFTTQDILKVSECPTGTDIRDVEAFEISADGRFFVYSVINGTSINIWRMHE